jgi:CDP-diacylglycerol--glycerol-3-phosphate 3-phosphatidyltransferase
VPQVGIGQLTLGGAKVANWPNLITVIRTVGAIALGIVALLLASWVFLLIAYLTYWLGDIADGRTARALKQETRLGGVFDILSDRACSTMCIAAFIVIQPAAAPALGLYFVQFVVLDCLLSLGFLHWPEVLSPNYFYVVDRPIWRMNWSQPAKALNTGLLIVLLVGLPYVHAPLWIAAIVAGAQIVVKLWSGWRMLRLTTVQTAPPAPGAPTAPTVPTIPTVQG